jgi:hypothetical protein
VPRLLIYSCVLARFFRIIPHLHTTAFKFRGTYANHAAKRACKVVLMLKSDVQTYPISARVLMTGATSLLCWKAPGGLILSLLEGSGRPTLCGFQRVDAFLSPA